MTFLVINIVYNNQPFVLALLHSINQSYTLKNMAPSVPISILVVALVLCIFMHATTMVIAAGSVAASKSPALELEAKALMETRWWNGTSNGTSLSHCKWRGITCSDGGSCWVHVTPIESSPLAAYMPCQSSFMSLVPKVFKSALPLNET